MINLQNNNRVYEFLCNEGGCEHRKCSYVRVTEITLSRRLTMHKSYRASENQLQPSSRPSSYQSRPRAKHKNSLPGKWFQQVWYYRELEHPNKKPWPQPIGYRKIPNSKTHKSSTTKTAKAPLFC